MERQDVKCDSVADLRVAVLDDEDGNFFVADDMMGDVTAGHDVTAEHVASAVSVVQAGAPMGLSATPSQSPGHQVSGLQLRAGRGETSPLRILESRTSLLLQCAIVGTFRVPEWDLPAVPAIVSPVRPGTERAGDDGHRHHHYCAPYRG